MGITNIVILPGLKKHGYRTTYYSGDGYYEVHTPKGEEDFY